MKKPLVFIIILIVVVILALVVIFVFPKKTSKNVNVNTAVTNTNAVANVNVEIENGVYIKNASFTPSVLTVKVGDTVTWVNQDSFKHKIASDPHPTHTDLPELISGDLSEGQTYTFTFKEAGEFSYHDELNPIKKGIIKVQE